MKRHVEKLFGLALGALILLFLLMLAVTFFGSFPFRDIDAYCQYSTGFSPQLNIRCVNAYRPSCSHKDQKKIGKKKP